MFPSAFIFISNTSVLSQEWLKLNRFGGSDAIVILKDC